MEGSSSDAIFKSLNLNPQLFINEAFNTVDELFDEAFNYLNEEASSRLKTQGTDRHEELNKAVLHIKKLIHSNLGQQLQQWEEYCLRYSFRIPEGFSLPKVNEPSGLSVFDGLADTHLDAELNSLREKLTSVEKESAEISKEIHVLERETLSSNQSDSSIEEVVQLYNKNNNTQLFQEMITMATQFRAKVGNLKRRLTEETDCSRTDKIHVTDGNLLRMNRGNGIAIHLSEDVINNIFVDLDFIGNEKGKKTPGFSRKIHEELPSVSRHWKGKHPTMTGSVREQPANDRSVEKLHIVTPLTVKKAALEALEALLTVGGSMRSESWRASVDHLLITLATDACRGRLSNEEKNVLSSEPTSLWEDFQLAALRALLASLLSPGQICPSHLALALELFRGGTHETGTKLAEFCGHALLSLEVLIHPRSLPLLEKPSATLERPSAEVTSVTHASEAIETRVLENRAASPLNTAVFQSGAGASETEKLESFNNEIANIENDVVVKSGDDFVVACEPNASKSENVEQFEEDRCNAIIEGMSVTLKEPERS